MIEVEGFKAFHGVMRVHARIGEKYIDGYGDWLYNPDTDCWYGLGSSYPAELCEVLRVE
jgi:hypothetical protein